MRYCMVVLILLGVRVSGGWWKISLSISAMDFLVKCQRESNCDSLLLVCIRETGGVWKEAGLLFVGDQVVEAVWCAKESEETGKGTGLKVYGRADGIEKKSGMSKSGGLVNMRGWSLIWHGLACLWWEGILKGVKGCWHHRLCRNFGLSLYWWANRASLV